MSPGEIARELEWQRFEQENPPQANRGKVIHFATVRFDKKGKLIVEPIKPRRKPTRPTAK